MQRTIFNLLLFPSSLLLVLVMIDLDSCPKVTAFKCSPSASQKTITATDLAPFLTSNLLAILQAAAPPPRPSPERGVTSLRMQAGMSSQIITATYIVLISFQKVSYGSCHAGQIRATPPALIRRQMAAGTVAAPLCIQAKEGTESNHDFSTRSPALQNALRHADLSSASGGTVYPFCTFRYDTHLAVSPHSSSRVDIHSADLSSGLSTRIEHNFSNSPNH
jgi:hypothetical protein